MQNDSDQMKQQQEQHQQFLQSNIYDMYIQLSSKIQTSPQISSHLKQCTTMDEETVDSESMREHQSILSNFLARSNPWLTRRREQRSQRRNQLTATVANGHLSSEEEEPGNDQQRDRQSDVVLANTNARMMNQLCQTRERKYLFERNSPANYMLYSLLQKSHLCREGRLLVLEQQDQHHRQVYIFPKQLGSSHLSIEQWECLFQTFDTCQFEFVAKRSVMDLRQDPLYDQGLRTAWLNLAYTERIKDAYTFHVLESILFHLKVNPYSAYTVTDVDDVNHNDLVLTAIRRCESKHKVETDILQSDSQPPAATSVTSVDQYLNEQYLNNFNQMYQCSLTLQELQSKLLSNTAVKVLFVLLYYMNESNGGSRFVQLYCKFLAAQFDQIIVDQMVFVIYMLHMGSKCNLLRHNPAAVQWVQSELAKSLLLVY